MSQEKIINVARGLEPADLVIKNAQVVNVLSEEIHKADIAIADGIIVGVGENYFGKKEININLSTVYRALNALTESDIVIKQILSDGNSVFQLNNTNHQHILTCKMCGKVSYVDVCPVESILNEISNQTDYEITGHNLEFIGICPECSKKLI